MDRQPTSGDGVMTRTEDEERDERCSRCFLTTLLTAECCAVGRLSVDFDGVLCHITIYMLQNHNNFY